MPNQITTTASIFGTEDISHKPKRRQGDNFVGTPLHIQSSKVKETNLDVQEVPEFITLERAISYYDSKANSITSEGKMNLATANWLRELIELRAAKVNVMCQKAMPNVGTDLVASLIAKVDNETEEDDE